MAFPGLWTEIYDRNYYYTASWANWHYCLGKLHNDEREWPPSNTTYELWPSNIPVVSPFEIALEMEWEAWFGLGGQTVPGSYRQSLTYGARLPDGRHWWRFTADWDYWQEFSVWFRAVAFGLHAENGEITDSNAQYYRSSDGDAHYFFGGGYAGDSLFHCYFRPGKGTPHKNLTQYPPSEIGNRGTYWQERHVIYGDRTFYHDVNYQRHSYNRHGADVRACPNPGCGAIHDDEPIPSYLAGLDAYRAYGLAGACAERIFYRWQTDAEGNRHKVEDHRENICYNVGEVILTLRSGTKHYQELIITPSVEPPPPPPPPIPPYEPDPDDTFDEIHPPPPPSSAFVAPPFVPTLLPGLPFPLPGMSPHGGMAATLAAITKRRRGQ